MREGMTDRRDNNAIVGLADKKAPLPQKGGWGDSPPTHPTANRPAYPTVIPAQAGIQNPGCGAQPTAAYICGAWIPAFAGMTVG